MAGAVRCGEPPARDVLAVPVRLLELVLRACGRGSRVDRALLPAGLARKALVRGPRVLLGGFELRVLRARPLPAKRLMPLRHSFLQRSIAERGRAGRG